jgi:hypothetical protein
MTNYNTLFSPLLYLGVRGSQIVHSQNDQCGWQKLLKNVFVYFSYWILNSVLYTQYLYDSMSLVILHLMIVKNNQKQPKTQ